MGHPDKLADQISDGVLDALFEQDPYSRVACETMVTTGMAIIAGEVKAQIDYPEVVRGVIRDVGYTDDEMGICADTCAVLTSIDRQSPDIAQGVDENGDSGKEIGAGDQGLMFGFACRDTEEELMPLPIALSHKILDRLNDARFGNEVSGSARIVKPGYRRIRRADTCTHRHRVVSTQHSPEVSNEDIQQFIVNDIINPLLPENMVQGDITYHVNPTGRFVTGGPHGDCGLTGRKIVVDTYGGWGRHGGGAFSGKDPTKVDRSAAYVSPCCQKHCGNRISRTL